MVPRRIVPLEDGLSGLAKAFFYAGSRALLVSHRPVSSDAIVTLITRMFGLMNDNTHAHYPHPAFWTPFVVGGEGGRG